MSMSVSPLSTNQDESSQMRMEYLTGQTETYSCGLASLTRQVWLRKLSAFELKEKQKESFEED